MTRSDVLVLSAFRKATFLGALNPRHPIEEPWDSTPLTIAASIERHGLTCSYLPLQNLFQNFDIRGDLAALKRLLEGYLSRVVLFSSCNFVASRSTATIAGIRTISKILKGLYSPIIGITGRLATVSGHALISKLDDVDFVTLGEIELDIPMIVTELLQHGLQGLSHPSVLTRVEILEETASPKTSAKVPDLNKLPPPAFHLAPVPMKWLLASGRFNSRRSIPFSIRTTAGCKFACKFCAGVPFWNDYRAKSPETVAKEVEAFRRHIGPGGRISFLEDEIFTLRQDHVSAVAEVLNAHEIMLDGVYTHCSLLTEPVAEMLRGMTKVVCLGFDSADDLVLRSLKKGQNLEILFSALTIAKELRLAVHLDWMIGTPPEDVNSLLLSLSSISQLLYSGAVESIQTYVFCPHPGTEYGINTPECFEEMLESGGFPQYEHPHLTKNQVFTAYLMSQVIIAEVQLARKQYGERLPVSESIMTRLKEIVETVGRS